MTYELAAAYKERIIPGQGTVLLVSHHLQSSHSWAADLLASVFDSTGTFSGSLLSLDGTACFLP